MCGLVLTSALALGCFVDVSDVKEEPEAPRPATGTLTVRWTIGNRRDPSVCFSYGRRATDFELLVHRDDREVAELYARCEDFRITAPLPPGDYTGYGTLVDQNKDPLTTTLPLKDIEILKDADLQIDIDFPAGSFL
jgi:hypothetical protein